jgi:hypothetical protein
LSGAILGAPESAGIGKAADTGFGESAGVAGLAVGAATAGGVEAGAAWAGGVALVGCAAGSPCAPAAPAKPITSAISPPLAIGRSAVAKLPTMEQPGASNSESNLPWVDNRRGRLCRGETLTTV